MLQLGAPGVYQATPEALRALTGERLDVCAFAGVAPRGPAGVVRFAASWLPPPDEDEPAVRRSVPVVVESFGEYQRLFGGFEGPGRLPYAVAAFFENGGARAVVVRVVHGSEPFLHCSRGTLWGLVAHGGDRLRVWARNAGTWGDALVVRVTPVPRPFAFDVAGSTVAELRVSRHSDVGPGTTLRVTAGATRVMRRVLERRVEQSDDGSFHAQLRLDLVLPALPTSAELVEATVDVWESAQPQRPGLAVDAWNVPAVAVPESAGVIAPGDAVEFTGAARTVLSIAVGDVGGRAVRWVTLDSPVLVTTQPDVVLIAGVSRDVVSLRVSALRVGADVVLPSPVAGTQLLLDGLGVEARLVAGAADVLVGGVLVARELALDAPVDFLPSRVDVDLGVVDAAEARTHERFEHVGLSALHPRWLAKVLLEESALVQPAPEWVDADVDLPATLPAGQTFAFHGGEDGYADLVPDDFFGSWTPGEPTQFEGVHCLVSTPEVALVCAPDLYVPEPLPRDEFHDEVIGSGTFEACVELEPQVGGSDPGGLPGLELDPATELSTIIGYQRRLVDFTDGLRRPIALLDVPMRLTARQVLTWRGQFDSAFAAAYHPWLRISRTDDARGGLVSLPPSAAAAGVIAARERSLGVPHGPANVIVSGVVDVLERVPPARHDELHQNGVNVFLLERDGPRLTGARTLSRDPAWRQLSVRRLVTLIITVLERQMQWAVFQPNGSKLRRDLKRMIETYLDSLQRAGAFVGARSSQSFFVRCDDTNNPRALVDAGQLVVEVGVAPAEPMEFLVLSLTREADGALRVEEKSRG